MPNVSYDTLSIKIEADSKQANASIKNLSTNLRNLDEASKQLDTKRLIEVRGLLQSIAKIDFSNVTKGLQSVVSAFKAFNTKAMSKAFDKVDSTQVQSNYPTPEQNFELVGDSYTTGFETIKQELVAVNQQLDIYQDHIKEAFGDTSPVDESVDIFEQLRQALENAGYNGEQISAVFRSIKTESSVFDTEQLERLREIMASLGISAEEADRVIKHLKTDTDNLDKGAKKGANGLQKLINQFGKIMKYRIIRKLIQEIYKALSEGIKNVVSFDEATANTINELKSKFEFLKNSLGSILAPLIQMIAPILEAIMTIVGEVNNAIAEMFASFNGQETFASATDEVKNFNEEVKKSQSLGIDELNVVNQEDKSTGFEMKETTSEMGSVFKDALGTLKEIIDTIKPVLLDVVKTLKPVLQAIGNLLASIMPIIQVIVNLINQLVGKTADGVNKSIASLVNSIAMVLNVIGAVLKVLEPILSVVIEIIGYVIDIINEGLTLISDLVTNLLRPIFALLQVIFNVFSPILNTISSFLKKLLGFGEGLLKGFMQVAGGVLTEIANALVAIMPILEAIMNVLGFKWLDKTPDWARVLIGIGTGGLSEIAHFISAGHFASGGFPEDGFFYANSGELVGQFSNGQTAVANNAEIVEGIKQGVLEAMLQANKTNRQIVIQIDGKEVARAVNRQNANSGYNGINGGYKYGY